MTDGGISSAIHLLQPLRRPFMKLNWIRYIPAPVRQRLEGRHALQQVISNTAWLFADKIIRMGAGLLVGVWVARYLGPEQFGLFNYALAFVALFSIIANLGLDSIVVRDLVHDPERRDETLGTAFSLKLIVGAATFVLTIGAIWLMRPAEGETHWLVGIIAAGTIFQAFDTVDFWFQAQVRSKYTVYAKNAAFLVATLLKVAMILLKAPLVAFAWAGLAETVCGAVGLVIAYRINGYFLRSWRATLALAVGLLRDSWPLMLSGVVVMVYIKIDQVMLGEMLGNHEVGIYSAAVRLSEVWYFIPMAITASVFPAIVNAKKSSEAEYYNRLRKLYLLMVWLSLAVAVPVTLLAGEIVQLVFGEEYRDAAAALSINCWAGLFIFSGLVSNHWYLLENLSHYTLYRHVVGALANIGLNLVLIPKYGVNGAASATLITQFVTSYLFDLLNKPTRILFRIKSRYFFLFLPITLKHLMRHPTPEK